MPGVYPDLLNKIVGKVSAAQLDLELLGDVPLAVPEDAAGTKIWNDCELRGEL